MKEVKLPESWQDSPKTINIKTNKMLVLSDIHVPFHSKEALSIAMEYGDSIGVDSVYLNGDIADCYAISSFVKKRDLNNFKEELRLVREVLHIISLYFKGCKLYYKIGNHEERYNRIFSTLDNSVSDLLPTYEEIFGLNELGYKLIGDKDIVNVGNIYIAHGHEIGISGGVNPARTALFKTYANLLFGHVHRTSTSTSRKLGGDYITVNSTGCLCELSPNYMPINQWNHGFAIVERVSEGYIVHNKKIISGEVI